MIKKFIYKMAMYMYNKIMMEKNIIRVLVKYRINTEIVYEI